jgi:hypothetical protein
MSVQHCHEMWNWLSAGAANDTNAQFAATVLDVSRGTKVIAGILCEHLTDLGVQAHDPESKTLLTGNDSEALARLMVFSLDQLYRLADARVQYFNGQADKGSRA